MNRRSFFASLSAGVAYLLGHRANCVIAHDDFSNPESFSIPVGSRTITGVKVVFEDGGVECHRVLWWDVVE